MDIDFYAKIDTELSKIPYCSSKCNYYMVCPVCDRSNTELAVCSLRRLPEDKRRRFVNLYLRGRDGLKAESTELLYNLANRLDLKNSAPDMIQYIDTIIKIDRAFKVDQKKIVETPKIEQEDLTQPVEVVVTEKAKPKSPIERTIRQVEGELDRNPESLFNSPIVDQMVSGLNEAKLKMNIGQFRLPDEKIELEIVVDQHKSES